MARDEKAISGWSVLKGRSQREPVKHESSTDPLERIHERTAGGSTMNTQCPICRSRYRFTYEVADARGIAECGECDSVFDALTLLEVGETDSSVPESGSKRVASIGDRSLYRRSALPRATPWTPEVVSVTDIADELAMSAPTRRPLTVFLSGFFGLAVRNIARYRRRSLVAVGAVGAGVVALMLSGGFIEWLLEAQRESSIRSQYGHIQVVRDGYHSRGGADPLSYLLPERHPMLLGFLHDAAVETVAPRLYFNGLASRGETSVAFIGQGVDPTKENGLRESIDIRRGERLQPGRIYEAVVGFGLARAIGVNVGDRLVLLTSINGINAVEVRVTGIFVTARKAFDDSALRVPLQLAQELLRVSGSHSWLILLKETRLTDSMLASVRATIDESPAEYDVAPWYELDDFYQKTEKLFSAQVNLVRGVIGVLILLSISNTMMMSVMERTREIGTLMAIGFTRRRVLQLFLQEGFLIGACGAVVGLVIGMALAELLSFIGIPMPPAPQMSEGFTAGINLTVGIALRAMLVVVVFTTAATVYPAWKASRLDIVDALRHNR